SARPRVTSRRIFFCRESCLSAPAQTKTRSPRSRRDNHWHVAAASDRRMRFPRPALRPGALEFHRFDTISPAKSMLVNQYACLIGGGAPQQIVASRQLDLERSALID